MQWVRSWKSHLHRECNLIVVSSPLKSRFCVATPYFKFTFFLPLPDFTATAKKRSNNTRQERKKERRREKKKKEIFFNSKRCRQQKQHQKTFWIHEFVIYNPLVLPFSFPFSIATSHRQKSHFFHARKTLQLHHRIMDWLFINHSSLKTLPMPSIFSPSSKSIYPSPPLETKRRNNTDGQDARGGSLHSWWSSTTSSHPPPPPTRAAAGHWFVKEEEWKLVTDTARNNDDKEKEWLHHHDAT